MIHVKHNEFTEPSLLKNSGFYLFSCRTFCPFPLSCITPTSFGTRPLRGCNLEFRNFSQGLRIENNLNKAD